MEGSIPQGRHGTNLLVGILTLVTIAILAVVAGFLLEKENPLAPRVVLSARFGNVGGLKIGDPVTLAGANVGHVGAIRTSAPSERWPDPGYLVSLEIEDREGVLEWIREDSTFRIINDNLFGNRRIEISFGREGAPVTDGAVVPGEVGSGMEDIGQAVENIRAVTDELKVFVLGDGENQPAITDSLNDLKTTLRNLAVVSERIKNTSDDLDATVETLQFWKKWFPDKKEGDEEQLTEGEEATGSDPGEEPTSEE